MINDKAKKKNPRTVELPKTALLSRIIRCAEYVDDIILSPDFVKINLNMIAAKPQRREKREERKEKKEKRRKKRIGRRSYTAP